MNIETLLTVLGDIVTHPFMMMVYGLAAHFLKALGEIKKNTGQLIGIRQYYIANPYQTALAMIGAVAGYAIFIPDIPDPTAEVNRVILATAFTIGYMADSLVDVIGQRSGLNKPENKP